ncbi:MAG: hypothetical protein HJJLKODD_00911 [Phycisphaerae bacterium]|nr:hypothetical protein [Phycisphaerae bacterium]
MQPPPLEQSFHQPIPDRRGFWWVVGSALVLRLIWLVLLYSAHTDQQIGALADDSIRYRATAHYLLDWPITDLFHASTGGETYRTGEGSFVWNGPGYGAVIAAGYLLFGPVHYPILLLQIVAGAFGCGLVYLITARLLQSTRTAFIAGLLSAVSLTSIAVNNALLTDSLYYTLHLAGLWTFLRALQNNRWTTFILAGLLAALAIYIRPMGQAWPIMLLLFALLVPRRFLAAGRGPILIKTVIACSLAALAVGAVVWRNYTVHGVPFYTTGGPMAGRYYWVARMQATLDPHWNRKEVQLLMEQWNLDHYGPQGAALAQYYRDDVASIKNALREHPLPMLKAFIKSAYENAIAGDELHRNQLPQFTAFWKTLHPLLDERIGQLLLSIALAGVGWLIIRPATRTAGWLLLLNSGYFIGLSGLEYWQGSRICMPAQLGWIIPLAAGLAFISQWLITRIAADHTHAVQYTEGHVASNR